MKLFVVSILCLLAVSSNIATAQTVDSALAFFPYESGDKWDYDYSWMGGHLYYYSLTIGGDTVMTNSKIYKKEVYRRYSDGFVWYGAKRIDYLTGNVFVYLPELGAETLTDSLRAAPGEPFGCSHYGQTLRDTIFGYSVLLRICLECSAAAEHRIAYGLGIIYSEVYEDPEFAYWSILVHAIIHGREYGSPVSVKEFVPLPKAFELYPNYPNPFNPSTTIRYALPSRAHVTLTVFNTLGQQVATLVDANEEAGYHEARFDGKGLASGVYFYRLQAGDFVQTKRLLILR